MSARASLAVAFAAVAVLGPGARAHAQDAASAQDCRSRLLPLAAIPADLPEPRRGELAERRTKLGAARDAVCETFGRHNERCRSVKENSPAAAECAQNKPKVSAAVRGYVTAARQFNTDVNGTVEHAVVAAAAEMSDEFRGSYESWLRKTEDRVREATARTKTWGEDVTTAIRAATIPSPSTRFSSLALVEPGDILLLAPSDASGKTIVELDRLARMAESFAKGDVKRGLGTERRDVSHAVTAVQRVSGQLLFLDHTLAGSRILSERDFQRLYGGRNLYVARPRAVADGRALWSIAREAALQQKLGFGVFGEDDVVCTEMAALAVVRATGMPAPQRDGPVAITPSDFFDRENKGKYFVIMPFGKDPTLAIGAKP